jgi:hypothetical protein
MDHAPLDQWERVFGGPGPKPTLIETHVDLT